KGDPDPTPTPPYEYKRAAKPKHHRITLAPTPTLPQRSHSPLAAELARKKQSKSGRRRHEADQGAEPQGPGPGAAGPRGRREQPHPEAAAPREAAPAAQGGDG
uniref:Uncharacterized protein n=1 Tax=Aegilops tauschii subsp. strangulata TaxID=200361 RepID=A0A453DTK1_AEGTS